jgi:hypothetical protein
MEFRSTPRTYSYSPSQVFYGRRMKTDAPITAAALRMRTDLSAAESAQQRVSDTKRNSANLQSTSRPDMIAGQTVSVQNPTTKRWDKRGIIVEARDPKNRTFQVKVDGTIWTRSKTILRTVHIPLTDPATAQKGPQRAVYDQINFPPLNPPLPAPLRRSLRVQERKERESATVNAILESPMVNTILWTPTPTTAKTREDEKKKKKTLPQDKEKEEERQGLQQLPTCSTGCTAWPAPSCSLVRCSQQFPWDCQSCSRASSYSHCIQTTVQLCT